MATSLKKTALAFGFDAVLGYYNLHETRIDDGFQTEYFPLPVITLSGHNGHADLGVSLDKSIWLELTVDRQAALQIDYVPLARYARLEVYGAEDYLNDFCNPSMDPALTKERIAASNEQALHLCFYPQKNDPAALESLLRYLHETRLFPLPLPDAPQ